MEGRARRGVGEEKDVGVRSVEGLTELSSTIICLQICNCQEVLEAGSLIQRRQRLNQMPSEDLVMLQREVHRMRQRKAWVWRSGPIVCGLCAIAQVASAL